MKSQVKGMELIYSQKPSNPDQIFLFVHGIFSGMNTFDKMRDVLLKKFPNSEIVSFEYDYYDKMEINAEKLFNILDARYGSLSKNKQIKLSIICHSMGGLIARLVNLRYGHKLPFLRRIIMLGTPNFGVIRMKQMCLLAQMSFIASKKIGGVFTRKSGVIDLTKAHTIMKEAMNDRAFGRLEDALVDYVTTAGRYYHEDRPMLSITGDKFSKMLSLPGLIFGTVNAVLGVNFQLQPVHDGIVEVNSIDMSFCEDRRSEKRLWIFKKEYAEDEKCSPNYLHIEPLCETEKLTHTMIQNNEKIISMVIDVLEFPDLKSWNRVYLSDSYFIKPGNALVSK